MKKWQKILLGVVVLMGVIFAIVYLATKPIVKAGEQFFEQLGQEDFSTAYESTTQTFKDVGTFEQFGEFALQSKLGTYVGHDFWTTRKVSYTNGRWLGTLNGYVELSGFGKVLTTLEFEKEEGQWKVSGIILDFDHVKEVIDPEMLDDMIIESPIDDEPAFIIEEVLPGEPFEVPAPATAESTPAESTPAPPTPVPPAPVPAESPAP